MGTLIKAKTEIYGTANANYVFNFTALYGAGLASFKYQLFTRVSGVEQALTTLKTENATTGSITVTSKNISETFSLPSTCDGSIILKLEYNFNATGEYLGITDLRANETFSRIWKPQPRRMWDQNFVNNFTGNGTKKEVVQTWYNQIVATCSTEFSTVLTSGQGNNLRNRVAFTTYEDVYDGNDATYNHGVAYSYDIHGNAERIVQNIPSLKHLGVNLYTLDYDYDLLSGKVNKVEYQKNRPEYWSHKYEYDADNRLVRAYTSRDGYIWERDAKYFYYLHGPLGRTELGQLQVQGLDNAYTLHGWLKGVNSPAMTSEADIGRDGYIPATGTNTNQMVGRDAFAFYLSYFDQDYANLNGQQFEPTRTASDLNTQYRSLYNGNIAHMGTLLPKLRGTGSWAGVASTPLSRSLTPEMLGNVYHYDQLNRITKHYVFDNYTAPTTTGNGSWISSAQNGTGKYYEDFAFDANGNITNLNRKGDKPATLAMDEFTYNYDVRTTTVNLQQTTYSINIPLLFTNKLYLVDDNTANSSNYDDDIDDQGTFSSTTSTINTANNYGYDKLGNLVHDNAEEIASIEWTVTGKIRKVIRTATSKKADLVYGYDASGSRLFKVVIPKVQSGALIGHVRSQEKWDTTWYIKDASGNAMATYKTKHSRKNVGGPPPPGLPQSTVLIKRFYTEELYIYGSQRHGVLKPDTFYTEAEYNLELTGYQADSLFPTAPGSMNRNSITQNGITDYSQGQFAFWRGQKQYELSNHLGNVLVTIQDRKWGRQTSTPAVASKSDYYLTYIVTVTDYYAFGSSMKERTTSYGSSYRYGFNNQEKDVEMGEYYAFEYRIHDARIGRFFSVDPWAYKYSYQSPFVFASNCPISLIDWLGLSGSEPTHGESRTIEGCTEFFDATVVNSDGSCGSWVDYNPIMSKIESFVGVDGAIGTGTMQNGKFDPIISLSGSASLLIFIQDKDGIIDKTKMNANKGKWDYIIVKDLAQATEVLKAKYGETPEAFISNLVIKAHGRCGESLCSGWINDPKPVSGTDFINSLLTNNASILITSCSLVNCYWLNKNSQGWNNEVMKYNADARKTAKAFSEFFCKGTNRTLYLNASKSTSWAYDNLDGSYDDKNKNGVMDVYQWWNPFNSTTEKDSEGPTYTSGDKYYFLFNSDLTVGDDLRAGMIVFYYGVSGWSKLNNFYICSVDSDGTIHKRVNKPIPGAIAPIDSSKRK